MKPVRTLIVFGAGYLAGTRAGRDAGAEQITRLSRRASQRLDDWARRQREAARDAG